MQHRWSGWPGAWCLDCGSGDPYETALADGWICFEDDPDASEQDIGVKAVVDPKVALPLALMMICPEPNSNRHNPYAKKQD